MHSSLPQCQLNIENVMMEIKYLFFFCQQQFLLLWSIQHLGILSHRVNNNTGLTCSWRVLQAQTSTKKIIPIIRMPVCFHMLADWSVHQHSCATTPQCGHDKSWQDLQSEVHIWHVIQEHNLWNDAHQVQSVP